MIVNLHYKMALKEEEEIAKNCFNNIMLKSFSRGGPKRNNLSDRSNFLPARVHHVLVPPQNGPIKDNLYTDVV